MTKRPVIPSPQTVGDKTKRPVIFDLVADDLETSLLDEGMRLVLHINPRTMNVSYSKVITPIQTDGGWIEQHYGEGLDEINFDMATGGFVRLYSGVSNITGGGLDVGGDRRETLAYDKYLDLLALFHNNGCVTDISGKVALQGYVKMTFDEGTYYGWFNTFEVSETVESPYQFALSATFWVDKQQTVLRSQAVA
jgi:hypothetical protein